MHPQPDPIAARVAEILATAPKPTPEQITALRPLLAPPRRASHESLAEPRDAA